MGYLCKVDLSNAKFDHEIIIAHDSTKTNNFDSFLQFLRFTLTPGILQRMSFYECDKYFLWADFFLRSIFGVQQELYNETEHAFEKKHRREFHYNVSNEFSKIQSEVTFPLWKCTKWTKLHENTLKTNQKLHFSMKLTVVRKLDEYFKEKWYQLD